MTTITLQTGFLIPNITADSYPIIAIIYNIVLIAMAITVQLFLSPVSGESRTAVQGIQGAFEKLLRQTGEPRRDQRDQRDPSKVEMGHSQVTMGFK